MAPTPCTEWNVRDLVNHLVGMNLVFVALFEGSSMPNVGPTASAPIRPGLTIDPQRRCRLPPPCQGF